jgi:hypothetical protein
MPSSFLDTWIFVLVVSFVMMTIYPSVIAPLFNTYTPIPEGELRDKIVALATKVLPPPNLSIQHIYLPPGAVPACVPTKA